MPSTHTIPTLPADDHRRLLMGSNRKASPLTTPTATPSHDRNIRPGPPAGRLRLAGERSAPIAAPIGDDRRPWSTADRHGSHPGPLPGPIERTFVHGCVAACISGAYQASDRGGDRLARVIPRNPCQDNAYYLYNGAGSAVSRHRPCRRRRRRTRRSLERPSARPPPEGGRGVRVAICIDN